MIIWLVKIKFVHFLANLFNFIIKWGFCEPVRQMDNPSRGTTPLEGPILPGHKGGPLTPSRSDHFGLF